MKANHEKSNLIINSKCAPNGNRTRVSALRGQCPRPLDDGSEFGCFIEKDDLRQYILEFGTCSRILIFPIVPGLPSQSTAVQSLRRRKLRTIGRLHLAV